MNVPLVLLNRRRRGGAAAFTPAGLFALAEPGVWYDPSDLTTLFQDTAGTTPVTTPGQTVALALDKSKGLVLGSELVNNANWSAVSSATVSVSGTTVTVTDPGGVPNFQAAILDVTTVAGKWYEFSGFVVSTTDPRNVVTLNIWNGAFSNILYTRANIPVASSVSAKFQAIGSTTRLHLVEVDPTNTTAKNWVWRDISVKELPGFHATQATLASRPTYGIVPLGGRRNLLTYSEDFSNAIWTKLRSTATATKISSSATATQLFLQASQGLTKAASSLTYTFSVELKEVELRYAGVTIQDAAAANGIFTHTDTRDAANLNQGAFGTGFTLGSVSRTLLGDGYVRVVVTGTTNTGTTISAAVQPSKNSTFTSTSYVVGDGMLVRNSQLELSSSATAYQRVGSAFDVTEAGVASLSYLSFDGVDDFLITPTITPGIDKAQVFAGVRKLSDAAAGRLVELSVSVDTNNGTFAFAAPPVGGGYRFFSKGTTLVPATGAAVAPITNVITGLGDISGDRTTLRINGTQVDQSTTDQGTGNYLAYPLYIGRGGGATLPLNGQLYSLLVRFGTNLDAGTITSTETWVAGKTGVTL